MNLSRIAILKIAYAFISLAILLPNYANSAWLINWELGAFTEYSGNIQRRDNDTDDSIVVEPRGLINATHFGPNFDAEIGAANEYRSFIEGDQGSNNNFDLNAMLNWKISPGLFEWSIQNNFNSEFPIDIRSSPNEGNRQDINTFSTGPSFTPRIFNQTNLIMEGRYIRTDAEETDIDSDRTQARVGIERQLSSISSISLNYEYEDTDFDENTFDFLVGNIDFDRDNYFLAYSYTKPSLTINATLGYTEIERDDGPDRKSDGNNSQLALTYILNSTSSLDLVAYDQFTDTTQDASGGLGLGGGFGNVGGNGNTGIPNGLDIGDIGFDVTGDTVDTEGFLIGFNKQFSRLGTSFQYFQSDDDHDIVNINDRDSNGGTIEFTLPIDTFLLGLLGTYRTTDFDTGDREDDDFLVALNGEYFATRNLRLNSSIQFQERDSTIDGQDFDEFRVRIGLAYTNF